MVQKVKIFLIHNVKKIFVCSDHPLGGGNENSEYSHMSKSLRFPISTVSKDLLQRSNNTTRRSLYSLEFNKHFDGQMVSHDRRIGCSVAITWVRITVTCQRTATNL